MLFAKPQTLFQEELTGNVAKSTRLGIVIVLPILLQY